MVAICANITPYGPGSLSGRTHALSDVGSATWTGEVAGDRAGFSVCGVGDIDGDSVVDVAIGAKWEGTVGVDAGAVYIVDGDSVGALSVGDAKLKILAEDGQDTFGDVTSLGDVDGDGLDDVGIGARDAEHEGLTSGAAYVFFGATGVK